MAKPVRLRVVFDDRHLLTRPQRADGLRRCCLLLRPELSTISDFAVYLADAFALRCSSADGLLLSMDEFVLPSFESTDVFRDMDIVRVRKKVIKNKCLGVSVGPNCSENCLIMSKEDAVLDQATLVSRYPKKDFQADENKMGEENGNVVIDQTSAKKVTHSKRKRALSDKPQGKKKQKLSKPEDLIETEENIQSLKNENISTLKRKPNETFLATDKPSKVVKRFDRSNSLNDDQRMDSSSSMEVRHGEAEENCYGTSSDTHPADSNKKIPSRSSRRKKAKRRWRKEMAKHQQEPANDMRGMPSEKQIEDQINEVKKDLIPILVRPGHIRFDDEDGEKSILHSNGTHECSSLEHGPMQWSGTTNKKKGQKWGQDKTSNKVKEDNVWNVASHENLITEERVLEHSVDFESLYPLTRLPKEGDVVAYRLVEFASSWCPELCPFRVGKVISYDQASMKVVLVPVPEHPILPDEIKDEESAQQPNNLLYGDDGSLEIDYPSLINVRLLSAYNSEVTSVNNNSKEKNKEAASHNNWELAATDNNVKHASLTVSETNSGMGCEHDDWAFSKKDQPEKDGWGSWIPNKSAWSYSIIRASALGPTLSFLRGKSSKRCGSSNKHVATRKSGKY